MSVSSTDPSTLFGGTWEQLKDRFLLGTGDTYTAGSTGGSSTKTIAKENIPSYTLYSASHTHTQTAHNHTTPGALFSAEAGGYKYSTVKHATREDIATTSVAPTIQGTTITVTSGGSGTALDVMNPYLAVYMWKRTA